MDRIAIIPARGGSKRIPRKNIRIFNGCPMIAWSIKAILKSNIFERIIVSTDDAEIAEVAIGAGAEVPFLRDSSLADDHTGVVTVLQDVLNRLWPGANPPRYVCLVYATAPFLRAQDLREGLRILRETSAKFAISVTEFAAPIDRALSIEGDSLRMRLPKNFNTRSQDFPESYHDAGQFCWGLSENWLDGPGIFDAVTAPVILPRTRVQDIDTPEDWSYAELLARLMDQEKI